MKKGKFIVFDGVDGCGKDTQIDLLEQALTHLPITYTREPGGTPRGMRLRELLLDKDGTPSTPLCDFFTFWADRAIHMEELVIPALRQGNVFQNRGTSSTRAFQMEAEQHLEFERMFLVLMEEVLGEHAPDAYIIFDLPAEVALERCRKVAEQKQSRFDLKPLEYHERVRNGFRKFTEIVGADHVHFINADRTIEEVHKDTLQTIRSILED